MALNLSVKNVPKSVVVSLRERARRNHRSLQGELLAILEETVVPGRLTVAESYRRIQALKFKTPDEGTAILRADRDGR